MIIKVLLAQCKKAEIGEDNYYHTYVGIVKFFCCCYVTLTVILKQTKEEHAAVKEMQFLDFALVSYSRRVFYCG